MKDQITIHTSLQSFQVPATGVEIDNKYKALRLKTVHDREGYPILLPFEIVQHIEYHHQ